MTKNQSESSSPEPSSGGFTSESVKTGSSPAADSRSSHGAHGDRTLFTRIREATGTVYGDIGTSVLYTVMEITRETIRLKNHGQSHEQVAAIIELGGPNLVSTSDLLGGLSLIFWALILLTVKYDLLIMRADDRGGGGTFALWGLLNGYTGKVFGVTFLGYLVAAAAALLAADGIITPPISMLGAFEPLGETWSIIITVACLFGLFKAQWRGTSQVGGFFGWFMMLVWFPWIALKGLPWVFGHPEVFYAVNPIVGLHFLYSFPSIGAFVVMGVVVLAITGGEAKYADIGHFSKSCNFTVPPGTSVAPEDSGRRPITIAWFSFVLPCLLVNYAGQVGYMIGNGIPPRANSFYALTPRTGFETLDNGILGVDLFISAIAAFIASQALITGLFSITKQAIALGFMPRFDVKYTSREAEGQVYIPAVNWSMFVGCIVITLMFRNAGNLAAAYGIAVTGTMGITTLIFGFVAYYRWQWPLWVAYAVCVPILIVDGIFFGSNLLKIGSGGYFPVIVAGFLLLIMLTWQWGRKRLGQAFYQFAVGEGKKIEWLVSLREMLDDMEIALQQNLPHARLLVQGRHRLVESDRAAVFLCSRPIQSKEDYVPIALRVFLKKYGVLPSHVVLMHVNQIDMPYANPMYRYQVFSLGNDIDAITVTYGYLEQPDVRRALRDLQRQKKIDIAAERWIVEIGEEDIILPRRSSIMHRLRTGLFRWILRVSSPAHKYLGLVYDAAISKEIIPVIFDETSARVTLPELEVQTSQDSRSAIAVAKIELT
jgi:KUP system potassium uptake protein